MSDTNKTVSIQSTLKLLAIVLIAVFVGRIGTAFIVGQNPDLVLFFSFVGVAIVSFLLSFIIISPKLKAVPLNKFVISVIPLTLIFMLVLGFALNPLLSFI